MVYKSIRTYENINKANFKGDGQYGIPIIAPTQYVCNDWIGFNYAKSCKSPETHGVHMFCDDYQLQRLWNRPDDYIPLVCRFPAVMSPDFSLFMDFPKALQIYNHYRKHWLAAHWQSNGATIIPTICWSDKESYNWCFDGEPTGGCVAVSAIGTQMSKECRELFKDGYNEMMRRLQPTTILFYGSVPDCCQGNIIEIAAFSDRFSKG